MRLTVVDIFTPTERKLIDVLSDGKPHYIHDLMELIDRSDLVQIGQLRFHISKIRRKLPAGQLILCTTLKRRKYYQHVRLLASANDGRV